MGNYYSGEYPIKDNTEVNTTINTKNKNDTNNLKLFNEINTEFINNESTQKPKDSDYQLLLQKFNKLEIEKNAILEELNFFKNKYDKLLIKIDSEEILKHIIKKIN